MKLSFTEDREICDFCGKNPAPYQKCGYCNKAICYDCEKKEAKIYKHGVHHSGSDDAIYCHSCANALLENPTPMFTAYKRIESLRLEYAAWYGDFEKRSLLAEEQLKKLLIDK